MRKIKKNILVIIIIFLLAHITIYNYFFPSNRLMYYTATNQWNKALYYIDLKLDDNLNHDTKIKFLIIKYNINLAIYKTCKLILENPNKIDQYHKDKYNLLMENSYNTYKKIKYNMKSLNLKEINISSIVSVSKIDTGIESLPDYIYNDINHYFKCIVAGYYYLNFSLENKKNASFFKWIYFKGSYK